MHFSHNLRRLRLAKNMTQEQAAEALGVSAQSISRWECGTTLPDVTMLPAIAQLYCVTIDDLYKETAVAYENYAARLLGVFESTHDPEDFILADREYRRLLKSGAYNDNDLRLYGILYQYMMRQSRERAMELFNRVLDQGPQADPDTYWRVCRQKGFLLHEIGHDEVYINRYLPKVEADSPELQEWICLIQAYAFAEENETALRWAQKAAEKFPEDAILHIYMGGLYHGLKQYDQAFFHWQRSKELEPQWDDASYAMAGCYEELGDFEKACAIYTDIADKMTTQGFEAEVAYPRQLAQQCRDKLQQKTATP